MAREKLDGRLISRCDGCGEEVAEEGFVGYPGLNEFLGLGLCRDCGEAGALEPVEVLLRSDVVNHRGRQAVLDFLYLQAPQEVRDLAALERGDQDAADRLAEGRGN